MFEAELVITRISAANAPDSIISMNVRWVSRLPRFLTSFISSPAVVEALHGLHWVTNGCVLKFDPPDPLKLPIQSLVRPAIHQQDETAYNTAKRQRNPLRAKVACGNCRARKIRCDKIKPQYSNCRENRDSCIYKEGDRKEKGIHERLDNLEKMLVDLLQSDHRSYIPHKLYHNFSPLEPRYHPHRYIDGNGGREDFIEVLSPKLLPWLAKWADLDHEQTSHQLPAFFIAWQLKFSLHRCTMDPTMIFTDMALSMIPEIDGILRAQVRHNLSRLREHNVKELFTRTLCALLALHLHRSIGTLGILEDFTLEADAFVVLNPLSTMSKRIELLHLVHDYSFQFDLHFADDYPSGWFPNVPASRDPVTTLQDLDGISQCTGDLGSNIRGVSDIHVIESPTSRVVLESQEEQMCTPSKEELCRIIEKVGGLEHDPSSLISRADLWKYSLGLHHLSKGHCNSSVSETLASVNHCLRHSLKQTLRERANVLNVCQSASAFVEPVLDILSLNVGAEVTQRTCQGTTIAGRLRHITQSSDSMVGLHIESVERSVILTEPIKEVPFLWASGRFVLRIVEREIDLPLHWFSNS